MGTGPMQMTRMTRPLTVRMTTLQTLSKEETTSETTSTFRHKMVEQMPTEPTRTETDVHRV